MTSTTASKSDIRIAAWSFGRRCRTLGMAYRQLEAGNPDAVRVFGALRAREWGVEVAFQDGIRGVDIVAKNGVETFVWDGGEAYPEPQVRRTLVAANGGTIF